jgi:hypothetical protein
MREPSSFGGFRTKPINQYLVPDDNAIALRVLRCPPAGTLVARLYYTEQDGLTDLSLETQLLELRFPPPRWEQPRGRIAPLQLHESFAHPLPLPGSEHFSSTGRQPPCSGLDGVHCALLDLHDAFARRQTDRFLELIDDKLGWIEACYPGMRNASRLHQAELYSARMAATPIAAPLGIDTLHFHGAQRERLVVVRSTTRQYAIQGSSLRGMFGFDPVYAHKNGAWRVQI